MTDGHSSIDCTTYATYQKRILNVLVHIFQPLKRVLEVCKYCKGKNRKLAIPVQTHVCLSTNIDQKSNFLLPIMYIMFYG